VSEYDGPADLVKTPCTLYGDEPTECTAIVIHPPGEAPVMTKLLPSLQAVLAGMLDSAFKSVKKDHHRLFWTMPADVEHRAWHF
jgi:N-acetyl-gamma-glutamyl-phosphate reductase/acetylglutamate kinase